MTHSPPKPWSKTSSNSRELQIPRAITRDWSWLHAVMLSFQKTGLRFPQAIGRVLHEAKRGKCRETNFFYIIICCSIWREMLQQRTLYKKLQLCLYLSYFKVYSRSSTWQCSDPLRPVASCQILLQGPYFNLVNAQWFRLIEIVGQIGLLTSILIA